MVLKLELLSPISTETNQRGDSFNCRVLEPQALADSLVTGHIANLKRSKKVKGKSEMDLAFDTITLKDGRTGSFNATVEAVYDVVGAGDGGKADNEGTVRGKSTVKRDVKRAAGGALAGALIGGILGGAKGVAIGAAIGAGVGASTTLVTKGPDLEFKQGTQFEVRVNRNSQPVSPSATAARPPGRLVIGQPSGSLAPSLSPPPGYRAFDGGLYSVNVPADWQEFPGGTLSVFAPQGEYVNSNLTCGVIIGTIAIGAADLPGATESYVNALLRANTYLSINGGYQRTSVSSQDAITVTLIGRSPVTGRDEVVKVVTVRTGGNKLLYINVVAQGMYDRYGAALDNVLRSVRLKSYR
jgi:hypothetical protein